MPRPLMIEDVVVTTTSARTEDVILTDRRGNVVGLLTIDQRTARQLRALLAAPGPVESARGKR